MGRYTAADYENLPDLSLLAELNEAELVSAGGGRGSRRKLN